MATKKSKPKFRFYQITPTQKSSICLRNELTAREPEYILGLLPKEYWRTGCYYFRHYSGKVTYIYFDEKWYRWKGKEPLVVVYPYINEDTLKFMYQLPREYFNSETNKMLDWYKFEKWRKALIMNMRKVMLRVRKQNELREI